jgi:hypothetical protein
MDTSFSKNSKTIFKLNIITIVLILIFVVSPIGNIQSISSIVKIIILFILGYMITLNVNQINTLKKYNNMNANLNSIATNTSANNATNTDTNNTSNTNTDTNNTSNTSTIDNINTITSQVKSQLNANIVGSYIFIAFLVIMIIFILKSFII